MSLKSLAISLFRNVKNIPGWTTGRKIVVVESDDWGSIRLPSREVYEQFVRRGFNVVNSQYNRYDALESNDDLATLFDVLRRHKDSRGQAPCLTANVIVANPDFKRIKASNYREYYYEPFTETAKRDPRHDQVVTLYKKGMEERLFKPQFHGREHLNINRWMKALRSGQDDILFAFDQQTTYSGKDDYNFMEALDMDTPGELNQLKGILRDGLQLFKETFGFRSSSFIAPCYTWNSLLEEELLAGGVAYLQGGTYQYIPKGGFNNYRNKYHYLGQRNRYGQVYLTRNCFFEPSLVHKSDWVDYTMSGIRDAFRWNKPAILCTHRINFIGSIDESNRNRNLTLFDQLLKTMLRKWPDIEFMSSDELGDLIKKERSSG